MMIYWANAHSALIAGTWWWVAAPVAAIIVLFMALFLLSMSMNEYNDPRSRPESDGGLVMDAVVEVKNLKAYYRAFLFGIDREVRAVDDISLTIGSRRDLWRSPANRAAARRRSSRPSPALFVRR